MSEMLRKVLREPLLHFLALAILIFVGYRLLNPSAEAPTGRIEISQAKIGQLASLFAKTWQRPPSAVELKGLVDDYVKEEVYYRQALELGLDKEDTVIRRRLRQKMEFLTAAEIDALEPGEADLEAYLQANADRFRLEPMAAFQQIYLSRNKRGEAADRDAQAILNLLRADSETDLAMHGDQTLLPAVLPLTSESAIGRTFGKAFAESVEKLATGQWAGPIASSYGLHLVRVIERKEGRIPVLDEVRSAVVREWSNDKRKALEQERFETLLKRYDVIIEGPEKTEAKK